MLLWTLSRERFSVIFRVRRYEFTRLCRSHNLMTSKFARKRKYQAGQRDPHPSDSKDASAENSNRQELPKIPETLFELISLRAEQKISEWRTQVSSRVEIWRRKRKVDGPGTTTIIFREFISGPSIAFLNALGDYSLAYIRAASPFRRGRSLGSGNKLHSRTWRDMECDQRRVQSISALVAFTSIILAVAANELQNRGYVPSWEEDCANPTVIKRACVNNPCAYVVTSGSESPNLICPETWPNQALADSIKLGNTFLTLFLLLSIYVMYRYEADILSLRNHVEFKQPLAVHTLRECGLLNRLLFEYLLCAVHQVPARACRIRHPPRLLTQSAAGRILGESVARSLTLARACPA